MFLTQGSSHGDDSDVCDILSEPGAIKLQPIIGNYKIVVIDEAQRIPETGLAFKIIHDNFKDVQLIATGSSAFELANKIKEPLTGWKFEFYLHPLSFGEMVSYLPLNLNGIQLKKATFQKLFRMLIQSLHLK